MKTAIASIAAIAASLLATLPVHAELNCFPKGKSEANLHYRNDPNFKDAKQRWQAVTKHRYIEGEPGSCTPVTVPGYEGFPTEQCSYESADHGEGYYPRIHAKVIVLDPSAAQLADWSIHACDVNGASASRVTGCVTKLVEAVSKANGAQYPVVGSVVESICASSGDGECKGSNAAPGSKPRNSLSRDGVSVWYKSITKWRLDDIPDDVYAKLFDVKTSDADFFSESWRTYSRVSGATREIWKAWRRAHGASFVPDNVPAKDFDIDHAGWGTVSRVTHQSACNAGSNELFDAIVFSRGYAN